MLDFHYFDSKPNSTNIFLLMCLLWHPVFYKKIHWKVGHWSYRHNQKRFADSNDFLGNVSLGFFIIEIRLLALHKTVSISILKFDFSSSYIPRCFWCEALSTDILLKNIFGWAESSFFSWENYFLCRFGRVRIKKLFPLKRPFLN